MLHYRYESAVDIVLLFSFIEPCIEAFDVVYRYRTRRRFQIFPSLAKPDPIARGRVQLLLQVPGFFQSVVCISIFEHGENCCTLRGNASFNILNVNNVILLLKI